MRDWSLQLRVCGFTLPGCQILARRSLFSDSMLFFIKSKFKKSTNKSQPDIKGALKREAVQCSAAKNLAVNH